MVAAVALELRARESSPRVVVRDNASLVEAVQRRRSSRESVVRELEAKDLRRCGGSCPHGLSGCRHGAYVGAGQSRSRLVGSEARVEATYAHRRGGRTTRCLLINPKTPWALAKKKSS